MDLHKRYWSLFQTEARTTFTFVGNLFRNIC